MNTKHTSGPWKVQHSESKPAFNVIGTILGGKYKIARCPYVFLQDGEQRNIINDREREEAEANAKLISAAPELLQALRIVKRECDLDKWPDVERHINAAIKKATD